MSDADLDRFDALRPGPRICACRSQRGHLAGRVESCRHAVQRHGRERDDRQAGQRADRVEQFPRGHEGRRSVDGAAIFGCRSDVGSGCGGGFCRADAFTEL